MTSFIEKLLLSSTINFLPQLKLEGIKESKKKIPITAVRHQPSCSYFDRTENLKENIFIFGTTIYLKCWDNRKATKRDIQLNKHVNNKLIIILFCLCYNLGWGGDTLVAFHGSKINLPQGFKEFSKNQLATFKSTIFDRELMTVYEKKDDKIGLQRFIIYYDSLPGINKLLFEKIVELKLEVLKECGITFEDVKMDESKHCVYGRSIIHGDTSIFGFTIDEFGIMGIQFDHSNGISIKDKENFNDVITSIQHSSPYQYLPDENPKAKEAKKEMEHYGLTMTIAFVVMMLIWLIRKYAIKNK